VNRPRLLGALALALLGGLALVSFWPRTPSLDAGDRARVHVMRELVRALTEPPDNRTPNPSYRPLLAAGAAPISCRDCHDAGFEELRAQDPGAAGAARCRRDPDWMIAVMRAWVARLNERHGDRLEKRVTCTDCHARDPAERVAATRALMASFVRALREKPSNREPAVAWKPLLRGDVTCSTCHGELGKRFEAEDAAVAVPEAYANDHAFMVDLMERWVRRLNRQGRDLLRHAVTCLDCHDRDPRG